MATNAQQKKRRAAVVGALVGVLISLAAITQHYLELQHRLLDMEAQCASGIHEMGEPTP